jgi:hypothetical protein
MLGRLGEIADTTQGRNDRHWSGARRSGIQRVAAN